MFAYLDAFDADKVALEEMKAHYRRGGLGDGVVKKRLLEVLLAELNPIRERREAFAKDPAEIMRILKAGTQAARNVAAQTLDEVRRAMKSTIFPSRRTRGEKRERHSTNRIRSRAAADGNRGGP